MNSSFDEPKNIFLYFSTIDRSFWINKNDLERFSSLIQFQSFVLLGSFFFLRWKNHLLILFINHPSKNRIRDIRGTSKSWKESRTNANAKLFFPFEKLLLHSWGSPSRNTDPFKILSPRFRVLFLLLLLLLPLLLLLLLLLPAQLKYGRSRATLSAGQINVTKGQINAAASNEGEANSVGIN